MAIPEGYRTNFQTLLDAAKHGDLCLVECKDAITREPVMAVCAMSHEGEEVVMVPFAKMFNGNPYEELIPPELGDTE